MVKMAGKSLVITKIREVLNAEELIVVSCPKSAYEGVCDP
jgi:hypothetical protein